MGANWVPADCFPGEVTRDIYDRLLTLAQKGHMNMIRVWGGGIYEKDVFYDLCDEYGIMVWQEFMHSSSGINNRPPTNPEYVAYIRAQAERMIPQRRNHPSLVIWTGGNELMDDSGVPLDDTHPALATLKEAVENLDPGKPSLDELLGRE